jgi:hypothetical protein
LHHSRGCLAAVRNVPQGGVKAIERVEVRLKFGWGIFPTVGSADLNGTEHNVIKRLLGRLGHALQTQVDVLR